MNRVFLAFSHATEFIRLERFPAMLKQNALIFGAFAMLLVSGNAHP